MIKTDGKLVRFTSVFLLTRPSVVIYNVLPTLLLNSANNSFFVVVHDEFADWMQTEDYRDAVLAKGRLGKYLPKG